MKVGFTGTQVGMTGDQSATVMRYLTSEGIGEIHHGDCIGADAQAHEISRLCKMRVVTHPPDNPSKRAWCEGDASYSPKPYLARNRDIVNNTDYLIATPRGTAEEVRSGTWATVRYALKAHKLVVIIWPNGQLEEWRHDDDWFGEGIAQR